MPTLYFKNSVDQNWDTLGNWWSDVAFTEGFSGTLTGVTVTDTDATVTCDSTAGLVVGRPITGTGIDTDSTVASITNGTEFELSLPAIANGSSNLTCELHVIPVTGDDVVIATGNGTLAGTPSADVLGLVTVNGDSVLNVTLEAASFVFNGTSYAAASSGLTGNCTFNDSSYISNGTLTGNASFTNTAFSTALTGFFNPQQGTVSGTVDFPNGATFTLETGESWNVYAAVAVWTGNLEWVFNGDSYNATGGSLLGVATFNDTSYNDDTISSGIFNDTSYNAGTGYDATFNGSSYNSGTLTNATFTEAEYSTALTGQPNPQQGTVSGTVTFSSLTPVKFTLVGSETWTANTYAWPNYWVFTTPGHNWEFNDYSSMGDDVEFTQEYGAGLVFNDNSVNYKYVYFAPAGGGSYASPTAVFNDSSINADTGSLEMHGTTTFNHQSHCTGQVWGDPTITFNDDSVYDAVNSVARWNEGTYYFRGNSYIASGAFLGSGDAEAGPLTSYFYDQSQCQSSGASWNNPYSPYEYLSYPVQKTGHTYIRQHAADFLAWIDYFYASNFQGTLHLQFPEMDILGTGLL